MINKLEKLKQNFSQELSSVQDVDSLGKLEVAYLGRNGELTRFLRSLKSVPLEERKKAGESANTLKYYIKETLEKRYGVLQEKESAGLAEKEWIDVTLPNIKGIKIKKGHLHPITQVQYEIEDIFTSMGFAVLDGPEIESEYYNFEALNIPEWHPARDMQDTFYIKNPKSEIRSTKQIPNSKFQIPNSLVLRTQTSSVQVRAMQKYGAPIKAIVPGRTFRAEATDARHEHTFHQVEGLMIDKDISIAHLIAVLKIFLRGVLKRDIDIRLRPGYFPFVEPGMEVDLKCICGGKGCAVCKHTGWVEFMGCGMVHPNVLKAGNIDSLKFGGFAFGFGLERLAMTKYGIDDIRLFMSGDARFLEQF